MDTVIDCIKRIAPLSPESEDMLRNATEPCGFNRKEVMVRSGVFNHYAFFVEEGMTRSYWLYEGEEITTSFSVAGSIVFSMDELYYGLPSQEYVAAVDEVASYRILLRDLRHLVSTRLDLCNYFRIIHQDEYRRIHRTHKERLTLPAKERYLAFAAQFPEVVAKAPLGCIASYLGITLSTLSRLRNAGI